MKIAGGNAVRTMNVGPDYVQNRHVVLSDRVMT